MKIKNLSLKMLLAMLFSGFMTIVAMLLYAGVQIKLIYYIGLVFGGVALHFIVMFITAPCVRMFFRKSYNYNSAWFKQRDFEKDFYKKLKVKEWKTKVPSYDKDEYSFCDKTLEEIIMNMCHAEVVHEVIIFVGALLLLLAFLLPDLLLAFIFNFLLSCLHIVFVIVQRHNRPRVIKLYKTKNKKSEAIA